MKEYGWVDSGICDQGDLIPAMKRASALTVARKRKTVVFLDDA